MSDLIERKEAIDALDVGAELLRRVLDAVDIVGVEREKYKWGLELIESCISDIKELPSAQPEQLTEEERLMFRKLRTFHNGSYAKLLDKLIASAQPEIIRCKDCKNSEHWYRDRRRCFLWSEDGVSVFDDGFCNYAERRTDG